MSLLILHSSIHCNSSFKMGEFKAARLFIFLCTASAGNYTVFKGTNCFQGHGAAANIDTKGPGRHGFTPAKCEADCDANAKCFCFVINPTGTCLRRTMCTPAECAKTPNTWDSYIKRTVPTPPTPPTPPPPTPIPTPVPPQPTPGPACTDCPNILLVSGLFCSCIQ
jgi:hypothetical protein